MCIRVLIADPDEYCLDSYRQYLAQHGFDVVTATTGLDCVERLRDCVPWTCWSWNRRFRGVGVMEFWQ